MWLFDTVVDTKHKNDRRRSNVSSEMKLCVLQQETDVCMISITETDLALAQYLHFCQVCESIF